jgi:hypothetical protein
MFVGSALADEHREMPLPLFFHAGRDRGKKHEESISAEGDRRPHCFFFLNAIPLADRPKGAERLARRKKKE